MLFYAYNDNILDESMHTINKNTEALVIPSTEMGRRINAKKLGIWSCVEIRMQDKITTYR